MTRPAFSGSMLRPDDVQDLRLVADRHPHPVAHPDVQQVEQPLPGHRLVGPARGTALGQRERVRLPVGAESAQRDRGGLAGYQRGHLDARVGGGDLRIALQQGPGAPGRPVTVVRADT